MTKAAYRAAPLLALAFSLAPAAVHAAEAEADPTIIVTAPELTNEAEARVQKTAGAADVVSHQDYADKSIVSLRDTLAFSPGVYLQPRYGQEVRICSDPANPGGSITIPIEKTGNHDGADAQQPCSWGALAAAPILPETPVLPAAPLAAWPAPVAAPLLGYAPGIASPLPPSTGPPAFA